MTDRTADPGGLLCDQHTFADGPVTCSDCGWGLFAHKCPTDHPMPCADHRL